MSPATRVVVDTNVVSFLFKNHPLAQSHRAILADRQFSISLVTSAEIEFGMEAKNW